MYSDQTTTSFNGIADKNSILESINPFNDIETIQNQLLGLRKVTQKDGGSVKTYYRRIAKPLFTDQYVYSLVEDLSLLLNFTVQVSIFKEQQINKKVANYLLSLNHNLGTHGDDAYISDDSWDKIMEIHQQKYTVEINGVPKLVSGWFKFDITWDYDKPVTSDMLKKVKDEKEEVDQNTIFEKIRATYSTIIHASLNKSYSGDADTMGMLIASMAEMRKENTVIRPQQESGGLGGFFKKKEEQQETWQ
jgi:hypothetical protein